MLLRLANAGVAVLIGRVHGVVILGMYAATLAVATLAERFADNGLEISGIAEASQHREALDRIGTALYVNKTLFSLLTIVFLAAIGWIAGLSRGYWLIAGILTLRTFLYSYCRLNCGLLKALDKTVQIVRFQSIHFLVLCCAIFYVYARGKSVVFLLLCLLGAQFLEFLLSLWVLYGLGARFVAVSRELCWELTRRSTPIGLTYTLSTLMLRGDVLVLAFVASASAVGSFAAADTGLVMLYVVAWLFGGVLLADIGKLAANKAEFDPNFRKYIVAILAICIPAAAAALFLAPSAILVLYGGNFSSAGLPASIMAVAIPFIFLNAAFLSRAVARHAERKCLFVYGAGAGVSLLLNLLLGWKYGGTGIAISILLRELAMTIAFLRLGNLAPAKRKAIAHLERGSDVAAAINA